MHFIHTYGRMGLEVLRGRATPAEVRDLDRVSDQASRQCSILLDLNLDRD
jgi:hypothetical protein